MTAVPSTAWAEPTDQDNALALKLFDEGRTLLTAGKVAEACRKLEESWHLNPLPGTLLNLAVCHEQEGRTASAVAEFRQARALAERDHRDDRSSLANQHLRAIEGKVSSLVIVVGPDADRPDLSISRDGTAVGRTVWGSRIPIDPGEHVVEASAPNKKPWKAVVKVAPDGDVQTVTLKSLEDATPAPESAAPPPPVVEPVVQAPPPPPPVVIPPEHHGMSTRKTIGLVTAAAGLVGVGLGTYFGVVAIQKHGDPDATCTTTPCGAQSNSLTSQAGTNADKSTVAFAAGLVALGVGAFLWLGDSSGRSDKPSVSLVPSVGPGRGGFDLTGRF